MHGITGLRIAALRLRLEAISVFRAPEYKGALFRGGFGQVFRDLVCVTREPVCTGCPHLESCSYSLCFETPVLRDKFPVLRKYPHAPHPFVLTPPLDPRTVLPPRVEFHVDVTLIGHGIDYLPHFLAVFDAMGRRGRHGGSFRVRAVSARTGSPDSPLIL